MCIEYVSDRCIILQNISPYNTRLFKSVSEEDKVTYELKLASVATTSKLCSKQVCLFVLFC